VVQRDISWALGVIFSGNWKIIFCLWILLELKPSCGITLKPASASWDLSDTGACMDELGDD
jgi:hypothetical protein